RGCPRPAGLRGPRAPGRRGLRGHRSSRPARDRSAQRRVTASRRRRSGAGRPQDRQYGPAPLRHGSSGIGRGDVGQRGRAVSFGDARAVPSGTLHARGKVGPRVEGPGPGPFPTYDAPRAPPRATSTVTTSSSASTWSRPTVWPGNRALFPQICAALNPWPSSLGSLRRRPATESPVRRITGSSRAAGGLHVDPDEFQARSDPFYEIVETGPRPGRDEDRIVGQERGGELVSFLRVHQFGLIHREQGEDVHSVPGEDVNELVRRSVLPKDDRPVVKTEFARNLGRAATGQVGETDRARDGETAVRALHD